MTGYLDEMNGMIPRKAMDYALAGVKSGKCTEPEARAALIGLYQSALGRARTARSRPLAEGEKIGFRLLAGRAAGIMAKTIEALEAGAPLESFRYK